jgi:hypothetical protein
LLGPRLRWYLLVSFLPAVGYSAFIVLSVLIVKYIVSIFSPDHFRLFCWNGFHTLPASEVTQFRYQFDSIPLPVSPLLFSGEGGRKQLEVYNNNNNNNTFQVVSSLQVPDENLGRISKRVECALHSLPISSSYVLSRCYLSTLVILGKDLKL